MLCLLVQPKAQDDSTYTEIPVGVILNMRSLVGKTVHSCITITLFKFYKVNSHYETRIVVHNRDTHGESPPYIGIDRLTITPEIFDSGSIRSYGHVLFGGIK